MNTSYSTYLQFLSDLGNELERLTQLQHKKAEAARSHDLDILNECMKQEQAISLSLRGFEQKRTQLLSSLGLSNMTLGEVAAHCQAEYKGEVQAAVERLQHQQQVLKSAQEMARTVLEGHLRQVNQALEKKGVSTDLEEQYQSVPGTPPSGMRTDFRA